MPDRQRGTATPVSSTGLQSRSCTSLNSALGIVLIRMCSFPEPKWPLRAAVEQFRYYLCAALLEQNRTPKGCHAGCHAKGQKMGATPGATLKTKGSDGERWSRRPLHLVVVSNLTDFLVDVGGVDGTRTRGLRRDRPAF